MYINFNKKVRTNEEVFSGKSTHSYSVETKDEGDIGTIHFIRDANGIGSVEWCRGNTAEGFGVKMDLEKLINFLENKDNQKEA